MERRFLTVCINIKDKTNSFSFNLCLHAGEFHIVPWVVEEEFDTCKLKNKLWEVD